MASGVVDMEILLRTERLLADLRKIPGVADAEARKMAAAMSREWAKAEQASAKAQAKMAQDAQRASAKAEQEWSKGTEAIAKKVASRFGGVGADLLDLAGSAGGALGTVGVAASAAAAGVAVLATAVVGGATAVVGLINSAEEARDRLEGMSAVAPLSADTIDALDDWKETSRAASVASDVLLAKVGGLAAAGFGPAAKAATALASEMSGLLPSVDTLTESIDTLQTVTRGMAAVLSLGVTEILRYVAGFDDLVVAGDQAAEALTRFEETQKLLAAHAPVAQRMLEITEAAVLAETGASSARKGLLAATEAVDATTQEYVASLQTLNLSEEEAAIMAEAAIEIGEKRKGQLLDEVEATEAAAAAAKRKAAADKAAAEAARQHAKVLADWERFATGVERQAGKVADAHEKQAKEEAEATAEAEALARAMADLDRAVGTLESDLGAGSVGVAAWGDAIDEVVNGVLADTAVEIVNGFTDLMLASYERQIDAAREYAAEVLANVQAEADARQSAHDEWYDQEQEKIDAAVEAGEMSAEQAEEAQAALDARSAAKQKALDAEEAAALAMAERVKQEQARRAGEAWRKSKTFQIAQATVESVRAGISLIPAFAEIPGIGTLAPLLAAGAAAASLGTAIANIQATSAPEFPMGRLPGSSPDHEVHGAIRDDEAVLTGRGVRTAGGPDGVRDLNSGRGGGGNTYNLILDRRMLATVVDVVGDAVLRPAPGAWGYGRRVRR